MSSQTCTARNAFRCRRSEAVEFRRATTFIPAGVAILFAQDVWMTVSSLHCISFDPPMISVALSKESPKSALILASGGFHIRLLRSGEEGLAKGEGIACGAGLVEMDCSIAAIHPAGDHDFVVAQVSHVSTSDGYPVVYWRRGLHALQPKYDFIASRHALDKFVAAWENGTLPKVRWMHHETLTRFWADVLARFVNGIADPWQAAVKAVDKFGEDRDLHHLYYSFDVMRSTEARRTWVPPDLDGPY
jgi:flavin reductase (DIM6/NTAB) family NADH-FMN oxidoreductase RutF